MNLSDAVALLCDSAYPSHGSSAGVACSYYGMGEWGEVEGLADESGVLFRGGYGGRRTQVAMMRRYSLPAIASLPAGTRVFCSSPIASAFSPVKRKEYTLTISEMGRALNKKSRYNELTHPTKQAWGEGYALRELRADDLPSITVLHALWVANRLADPRVHQISFSRARYLRCCEHVLATRLYPGVVYGLEQRETGALAAVRVVSLGSRGTAFDLAFFGDRALPWAARAMQSASLHRLAESHGVEVINFGESTSKGLTHFKLRLGAAAHFSYYCVIGGAPT